MFRIHPVSLKTRVSFAILAITALGLAMERFALETHGQAKAKPRAAAGAADEPDLAADLDDAIRTVEAGEFQKFLERYAPVELLRKMRQEDVVEQAATMMAERPQGKAQLLAVLKALRKQQPRFDKSRGLATLDFDPFASGVPEAAGDLVLPSGAAMKLTGLGSDLPKALAEAIKLLENGDIAVLVERLFPPSEVARLRQPDQLAALRQQFEEAPELLTAMVEDFERMRRVNPELTDKGQLAVFKLPAEKERLARTVKLQKVGSDWRLFDDAPRVSAELVRQSKLKPRSSVTSVLMERVGGNWRFVELPLLGGGGN
jgi:hypothetical protein